MLANVQTATIYGLEGIPVQVEIDVAKRGFPTFTIVGLPNKAIDEAKERVRTAIHNSGFTFPEAKITVNLAPADIPKKGTSFDLAIAIGILAASGAIEQKTFTDCFLIGELSLQGEVRRIDGIIPVVLLAQEKKVTSLFLPQDNLIEAAMFEGVELYPVVSLRQLVLHLKRDEVINPANNTFDLENLIDEKESILDFADIRGQHIAKRALEIAAAGFHNVHLKGPPGAGKTLLSKTLPTIMPELTKEEMIEVAKIYSVIGKLQNYIFAGIRPFRSPHHTTSKVGLIGGGSSPSPGEISLAHRGVLFLDEFPEFPRNVLEALRQPLEDGVVTVSRAAGSFEFPANFLLIAASNPCPCGYLTDPKRECVCSPGIITRYQKRLSGPLLDRIDIHLEVPPVEVDKLTDSFESESSQTIRERVKEARKKQQKRFQKLSINFNSELSSKQIKEVCEVDEEAKEMLKSAVSNLSLSARAYFKTIKVAQTIADLAGSDVIQTEHVAEALQYRSG